MAIAEPKGGALLKFSVDSTHVAALVPVAFETDTPLLDAVVE